MTVPRFRKKPVEIEAVQWTGDNLVEVAGLIGAQLPGGNPDLVLDKTWEVEPLLMLRTIHGEYAPARVGDWVIPEPMRARGYPVKPDVFAATYDPVEAS